ncbi:hypothetical protein I4I84_13580 [Pseudonocardia sp. KRD-182]|uniref:hypothetical protein n=1 Tax=Pseudonocardia oceani TaxID=2792013 RepID=UPI001C4A1367|nr:hypothetical protein [Pseudonocardia oceani]MBW0109753.1 hypothetical protein [Pseudonocardia oceani]
MTGGSAARVGLRAVFAQPGYRRLWSARTTSQAGDVFATVALALLMFDARDECRGPAKFAVLPGRRMSLLPHPSRRRPG